MVGARQWIYRVAFFSIFGLCGRLTNYMETAR